jgi:flagellar hook-length control protein FliK
MNVNLTTIAVSSASSAQSACGHSANKTGGPDDAQVTSAGDSQVTPDTATNRTGDTDNEVKDKASTTSSTKESQTSQAGDTQVKVSDKTGGKTNSDFKKVLKRHLKQDEAESSQIVGQDTTQSQTSVANDAGQTAQACSLPVIQVEVVIPDQQPAEDVSTSIQSTQTDQPVVQINQTDLQTSQTVSQVPVQAISVSLPQTQTVDNGVQTALQDTQGQIVQLDALQKTQIPVFDETQAQVQDSTNTAQAIKPTTPQMPVINHGHQQQQGQEQTQPVPVQMTSTDTVNSQDIAGKTQKNTDNDTVKPDVPVKSSQAGSDTSAVTSNQDKSNFNANVVSTDSTNQAVSEQPKAQSVDLSATTTPRDSDASCVATTTTTAGQQTGKETTTHNNAQNKSSSNQQDTTLLTTDSRTALPTVNGLAGGGNKAEIETVSLQNAVSQPQSKSQTDSLSIQSLGLHAMAAAASHVTDAQPVIVSHSAATTNNTSAQDTTTSLREQICMSVQNSVQQGQHQITINLNPPELGRVSIKFTEQNGQLTGSLEATNSQTRADIQQAMPEMIRSLEQAGINIKRIDVSLSDISGQSSHDFSRESASQNRWEQLAQQGFDDSSGGRFFQDSYVASSRFSGTSEFGGTAASDWNQSSSSENLLNVLI